LIQMYNVTKVYAGGNRALVDVSLKIEKGDFVFLVGASGAGKSSFMKLLLREELPSRGQIFVAGKNLVRMKRRDIPFLRRNLGMVFQDFRLLPNYTVFENIAFALRVVETSDNYNYIFGNVLERVLRKATGLRYFQYYDSRVALKSKDFMKMKARIIAAFFI
jgi:ABC-type ATPase involved in cell division